jgi:O-antigen ligase
VLQYGPAPQLDRLLLIILAATLAQVVPLPRSLLPVIAPAGEPVARTLRLVDPGGPLPVSIDPHATVMAFALLAGVLLLFVTARRIFERGGIRTTIRGLALMGLILSAIALAQDATAHGLMYWRWRPIDDGPLPFGPFVNRNHFATWGVMTVPVLVGYLTAHTAAHRGAASSATWVRKIVASLDARGTVLIAATAVLIVAIAASLSRSGLVGLGSALALSGVLMRVSPRAGLSRSARPVILILGGLAMLLVLVQVGAGALVGRFAASGAAIVDRLAIWRDTTFVLRDFWLTGTGAGTYQTAMTIYQRSSPGVLFNQAHNHYLQVAAEGGLLLGIPVGLGLWAFTREAWLSLRTDRSGMYWVRVGTLCGLFGAAIQSLLETGLTTPANAALAAVLAAIATHVPAPGEEVRHD